jgi:O-antigen ligase
MALGRRSWVLAPVVAAGLLVVAAASAYVMYIASPIAAVGALVGVGVAALVLWRPIFGVCFGFLAVPLEVFQVHVPLITSITVAEVLFGLTGIAGAMHLLSVKGWRPAPVQIAFLAMIAVALTGFFFAQDTAVVNRISRVWLAYLFVCIVVSRASRRELQLVLMSLAIAGALVAVAAILNTGSQVVVDNGDRIVGRASSGFAHPNVLAFFLVMSMPQAIVLAGRGPLVKRLAMGAAAAAIFVGLLLTLTRSALVGGGISLIVLLTWPQFRRLAGVTAIVAVFAFVVLGPQAPSATSEVSVLSQRLSTVNASGLQRDPRIPIWRATPGIIAGHPIFGVGEGNFPNAAEQLDLLDPANELPYDHAHDIFLTVAAELGLVGLAVFLVFLFLIVRLTAANLVARDDDWPLKLGVSAAMVGMLVTSLTEYPPRTNVIMATLLVLVGVLVGFRRLSQEADSDQAGDQGPGGPGRPLSPLAHV